MQGVTVSEGMQGRGGRWPDLEATPTFRTSKQTTEIMRTRGKRFFLVPEVLSPDLTCSPLLHSYEAPAFAEMHICPSQEV